MIHAMKRGKMAAVLCLGSLVAASVHISAANDQQARGRNQELDAGAVAAIIEEVAQLVSDNYVFEDKGREMAEFIRSRLMEGAYGPAASLGELTKLVTNDLRSVADDAHLGLVDMRRFGGGGAGAEDLQTEFNRRRMPYRNYGFQKVDRLPGNIGYIELDEFAHVELDGKNFGGESARAALRLISNCSAVIFDLRDNFGGRDEMANKLLSAFFDPPQHILTDIYRGRPDRELWTQESEFAGQLAGVPLYVLISQHTVSGGEMFAFVLKNRKRAILVGETTRGAAHKTHLFPIKDTNLNVAIPVGTVIDPVTGTDWEGSGVQPDISVSPGKALATAYLDALEKALQADPEGWKRVEIGWAVPEAEARLNPVDLKPEDLVQYAGQYGERRITVEDGSLSYQREGAEVYELRSMSRDLFRFQDPAMFYVRLKFLRDDTGRVATMVLLYDTGQKQECLRTERSRNNSV
ncbi:S41 family peptidase [Acidobacteriota bacterium]